MPDVPRLTLHCTLEMPEPVLFPFLRLLRHWEARQADVHVRLAVTTTTSYTTEELTAFLRSLDPPLERSVRQPQAF